MHFVMHFVVEEHIFKKMNKENQTAFFKDTQALTERLGFKENIYRRDSKGNAHWTVHNEEDEKKYLFLKGFVLGYFYSLGFELAFNFQQRKK
jgi:hypothetical protein